MYKRLLLACVCFSALAVSCGGLVIDWARVHRARVELGQPLPITVVGRADGKTHRKFILWNGDSLLLDPAVKSRPFAFNVTKVYGPGNDCSAGMNKLVFYKCTDAANGALDCKDKVREDHVYVTSFPTTLVVEGDHAHLVRYVSSLSGCVAEVVLAARKADRVMVVNEDGVRKTDLLHLLRGRSLKEIASTLFG